MTDVAMEQKPAAVPKARSLEVIVPFAGLIYGVLLLLYFIATFAIQTGGIPDFLVFIVPFGVVWAGAAVGVWRQSRAGYIAAVASIVAFLAFFIPDLAGALTEPHNSSRFVANITVVPVLIMTLAYSIPRLRRQLAPAVPPRTIPRSGVIVLFVLGFIVGGLLTGLVAGGVVARILASSAISADVYMVAGASSPSNPEFFSPATIEVSVGDSLTWVNRDSTAHSITSDTGAFDSGLVSSGGSWERTFTQAGTYGYYCEPHPWMKGTITVTG